MTTEREAELPKLPEPYCRLKWEREDVWTKSDMRSYALSAADQREMKVREDARWTAINEAQNKYSAILIAAIELLAEVDNRHDVQSSPLKYTIPYGAINKLRNAIGLDAARTQGEPLP